MIEGPILQGGHWLWRDRKGDVEVRFTGRGLGGEREEVLARVEPGAPPVAWAKQIHSAHVLPAHPGHCGEGDALISDAPDLALSVVTADCVPVLLAGPNGLASVHAGWRGLVGGVIPAALEKLGGAETAWIGPTIGPCCYEVGEEVAEQFPGEAVVPGPAGKPHLDLIAAARHQLQGVEEIRTVAICTRCEAERLYSYRREGKGVGRNVAFIWRRSEEIEYPTSDGQPMAETTLHRKVMTDLIEGLERRFQEAPDVWVGGNLFLYFERGNPRAVVAPDVLLVKGVPKWDRPIYKLWEEGEPPSLVVEVTSEKTRHEDLSDKRDKYLRLGVEEYFLFDPYGDYLDPHLQGYRLERGRYVRMIPEPSGSLLSRTTGLLLEPEGVKLRLVDPATGERLLWSEEKDEEIARLRRELERRSVS